MGNGKVVFFFGKPDVDKLRERKDVKGLIKALSYKSDVEVRKNAAYSLGLIRDQLAIEPLITAMKDSEVNVREQAACSLGLIRDLRAVEPLVATLKDTDERVRCSAARSLGWLLEDPDLNSRVRVAQTLSRLGWKPGEDAAGAWYCVSMQDWKRCVEIGKPAVEPLIKALMSYSAKETLESVVVTLGEIGDPRAVEPLIATMKTRKTKDWVVSCNAAEALGKIGDTRAVEPLIYLLRETDSIMRATAVTALGEIGDPRAVEPLQKLLSKDDTFFVLKNAAKALFKLGWKPGDDAVEISYWIYSEDWKRCIEIGRPAVEPLIKALSYGSREIMKSVIDTLGEIGDPRAVEPLIAALINSETEISCSAATALVKIGDPRAIEPMLKLLNAGTKVRRRCVARFLVSLYHNGSIGEERKQAILAVRDVITSRHDDFQGSGPSDCVHRDSGIGVDFPL